MPEGWKQGLPALLCFSLVIFVQRLSTPSPIATKGYVKHGATIHWWPPNATTDAALRSESALVVVYQAIGEASMREAQHNMA